MLRAFRCSAGECLQAIRLNPLKSLGMPILLCAVGIVIRIFSPGTYTLYLALNGRGIFPGAFIYFSGYIIRLLLAGLTLSSALFCTCLYEDKMKTAALAAAGCFILLFEYKLIFAGMNIFMELLLCAAAAVAFFASLTYLLRARCCGAATAVVFIALQVILFIQLISLLISL